ncbi:unnamed protein product [Didymodactylos carnosus]|uniref:Uncharacterized protein n=1 Tax=Didymodactylos carnosus TaxID=1234261 RepID=A0A815LLQ4_9BILA|nr:unnamed protein product [Didymodactylos carnosus]CAF1410151.1 unnamed protein product [Didymodactylos carnosus]CAF3855086.1 unnamed protein product [Didymodactylos carnosus]CAF4299205.1 unnamed protein product [Didymodactylos carnosus]
MTLSEADKRILVYGISCAFFPGSKRGKNMPKKVGRRTMTERYKIDEYNQEISDMYMPSYFQNRSPASPLRLHNDGEWSDNRIRTSEPRILATTVLPQSPIVDSKTTSIQSIDYVKMFDNEDECVDYLTDFDGNSVLIISPQWAQ